MTDLKSKKSRNGDEIKYIGDIENTYLIGITIGKGAYGTVKKVKNKKNDRIEAVKFVSIKNISKKEVEEELKVIKQLGIYPMCNQYIICYNDISIGFYNDIFFYIFSMEFFEGKELEKLIDIKNASLNFLPYSYIRTIIRDLLKGISFIHEKGISHRDIKSSNIMFNSNGLRIIDFGFACLEESCDQLKGTPLYFPPEKYNLIGKVSLLYTNKREYEEKADIWALGVILLELLSNYDIDNNIEKVISKGGTEKSLSKILNEYIWKKAPNDLKLILLNSLKYDINMRSNADDLLKIIKNSKNKYSSYSKIWNFFLKCEKEEEIIFE